MEQTIMDLLNSGMSPEDILKLAQEKQEELNKTKADAKRRAGARVDFIRALNEYVKAISGEYLEVETVQDLTRALSRIEDMAELYVKRYGTIKGFSNLLF